MFRSNVYSFSVHRLSAYLLSPVYSKREILKLGPIGRTRAPREELLSFTFPLSVILDHPHLHFYSYIISPCDAQRGDTRACQSVKQTTQHPRAKRASSPLLQCLVSPT